MPNTPSNSPADHPLDQVTQQMSETIDQMTQANKQESMDKLHEQLRNARDHVTSGTRESLLKFNAQIQRLEEQGRQPGGIEIQTHVTDALHQMQLSAHDRLVALLAAPQSGQPTINAPKTMTDRAADMLNKAFEFFGKIAEKLQELATKSPQAFSFIVGLFSRDAAQQMLDSARNNPKAHLEAITTAINKDPAKLTLTLEPDTAVNEAAAKKLFDQYQYAEKLRTELKSLTNGNPAHNPRTFAEFTEELRLTFLQTASGKTTVGISELQPLAEKQAKRLSESVEAEKKKKAPAPAPTPSTPATPATNP